MALQAAAAAIATAPTGEDEGPGPRIAVRRRALAEQRNEPEFFLEFAQRVTEAVDDTGISKPLTAAGEKVNNLPLIGEVTNQLNEATESLKRLGLRATDEVVASQAARMINSIGATMLNALHDHAMPQPVHKLVDDVYEQLWPEVKKTFMDAVMLSSSFEFQNVKQYMSTRDSKPPKGLLRRLAARFIYAMEPYDQTIWGTIRSPLSLLVQLLFFFPFYGVSDVCVISLALVKLSTDFDEYGLIQHIVTSKKLQFITSGLMSGTYAFTKLFVCATLREDDVAAPGYEPSYFRCENFAPGMHPTFPFEICLFFVRSALNWGAFLLLWNFKDIVHSARRLKKARSAQQRLAHGAERRGLFPASLSQLLVAVNLGLLGLCAAFAFLGGWSPGASFWDVVLVAIAVAAPTHTLLGHTQIDDRPAKTTLLLALVAALYLFYRLHLQSLAPLPIASIAVGNWTVVGTSLEADLATARHAFADPERLPTACAFLLACVATVAMAGLVRLQARQRRRDEEAARRLRQMMDSLNADYSGMISKAEMRTKYEAIFLSAATGPPPAAGASGAGAGRAGRAGRVGGATPQPSFDQFWAHIDRDGDGYVTLQELADVFGVSHLVAPQNEQEKPILPSDPRYIEHRLEQLHQREFGVTTHRPGGALLYFVIWDICAFFLAWMSQIPFIYREIRIEHIETFDELFSDWRARTAVYFLKTLIALLSFPFLVFALPLMQGWLTHVKPTGYDRAGNCVPKLSSSDIKAKFRERYLEYSMATADRPKPKPMSSADWYADFDGVWDRAIGVDAAQEMELDSSLGTAEKEGKKASVVEAARQRRQQQARQERLPEASLLVMGHASEQRLEGKLQLKGDPSLMLML